MSTHTFQVLHRHQSRLHRPPSADLLFFVFQWNLRKRLDESDSKACTQFALGLPFVIFCIEHAWPNDDAAIPICIPTIIPYPHGLFPVELQRIIIPSTQSSCIGIFFQFSAVRRYQSLAIKGVETEFGEPVRDLLPEMR
jgi:hypothetical protein